jgi:hypothetical protein
MESPPDAALRLLTLQDAAELVGVDVKHIRAAAKAGDLRVRSVGPRTQRTTRAWLYEWIHGGPTSPRKVEEPQSLDLAGGLGWARDFGA